MKIIKRTVITVVSCLLGAVLLFVGVEFGKYIYSQNVLDWEDYQMSGTASFRDNDENRDEEWNKIKDEGYRIHFPLWNGSMNPGKLIDCYAELTNAGRGYAHFIARKYRNNADLDAEVEVTSETVTIKFTGTGYNPDGTEDDLARTYIFDVDGAGKNKLPRLINKADIFPEL